LKGGSATLRALAALALVLLLAPSADAAQVRGYYRRDGTYVQPYVRSAPNSTIQDNYGYRGNDNSPRDYSSPKTDSSPGTLKPPDKPRYPTSGRNWTCVSCPRDADGRIARDENAVREFKRLKPEPPGCVQCEVDHIIPLHRGGADHPSNMQWLPKAQHLEKTRREAGTAP
jgi:hypothetical protein